MTSRRELLLAVGLCLAGSALLLLAFSRAWVSTRIPAAAPLPSRGLELTGSELAPGGRALALVGLAGVAALPASRAWGRVVVGVVLAAVGLGAAFVVTRALLDRLSAIEHSGPQTDLHFAGAPSFGAWPSVALAGAALLAGAGALVAVRGRSWAAMSARYDAPTHEGPRTDGSLWDALDRGEDPTGEPADTGG